MHRRYKVGQEYGEARLSHKNKLGDTEFRVTQFSVSIERCGQCYFRTALICWKLLYVPSGTPDHS